MLNGHKARRSIFQLNFIEPPELNHIPQPYIIYTFLAKVSKNSPISWVELYKYGYFTLELLHSDHNQKVATKRMQIGVKLIKTAGSKEIV